MQKRKLPEERLLSCSPRLPEELVGGKGPVDVAEYHLFVGCLLKRVIILHDCKTQHPPMLGSVPVSSDTVESERRQIKQC